MPTSYPSEFRRRAIALVRSGWSVTKTAHDLDVTTTTIYNWVKQDRIDRGEIPGVSTKESKELVRARRRIRELETEVEILRRAHELLGKDVLRPKGAYPVIDTLVGAGFKVKKCCEVLGISSAGYYLAKTRPMSPTMIRRGWLTGLIREVHADSRGTYGSRRVHAELTKGRGVHVSLALVRILMHNNEIVGIPGPRKVKRIKRTPTSDDLVQRKFERSSLDELWVTDITEHPTREGKVYCCCVLDTCSRRIVGWSIDSAQDTTLVVNALDMAIKQRRVKKGSIVHADHGTQFTSWSFTERIRDAGLMPSFGSVGDAFDNAMMESFWSSMQNELLYRKKWKTRLELSNAIFDYVEIFYNRQRRHSSIDYASPVEFELSFKEEKTA